MKNLTYLILFIALACNSPERAPVSAEKTDSLASVKTKAEPYIGTGKLIPINFSDTNYVNAIHYAVDTITPSGWQIKYLIKDDSTRYLDMYIQWSKGNIKGLYKAERVLEFRRYFIPTYMGESHNHILFWHGCATDCQAILVCEEDSTPKAHDIPFVVSSNLALGQIVYVPEEAFTKDIDLDVAVMDLANFKEHTLTFKGIPQLNRQYAFDTIIHLKNKVSITALLRKSYADTVDTKITQVVQLH
jgi:hypothetical protein